MSDQVDGSPDSDLLEREPASRRARERTNPDEPRSKVVLPSYSKFHHDNDDIKRWGDEESRQGGSNQPLYYTTIPEHPQVLQITSMIMMILWCLIEL